MTAPRRMRLAAGGFVTQRAGGELEAVADDRDYVAVATYRLDLGRRGLEHDCGMEIVAVAQVLERTVERRVELARVVGEADKRLRTAIAMASVVVEQAPAHRGICGVLVGLAYRRVDPQPAGIALVAVGFDDCLARHFGDEFGVRGVVAQRLPHDQRRRPAPA